MEAIKKWGRAVLRRGEPDDTPKTIPIYFVFFIVLNYTMGTGFLGVPFAFYHSGIITATLTLLVISILCYAGAMWWIESLARAQALETWNNRREDESFHTDSVADGDKLLLPKFEITLQRKFEPSELCKIYFGTYGQYSFAAVLVVHVILICWVCATVAGSSLASNVSFNFGALKRCDDSEFHHEVIPGDGCKHSYRFSVFLYSLAVFPLCMLELSEQKYIQGLLGAVRLVAVGCIVVYSVVNILGDDDYPDNFPVACNRTVWGRCDPNEFLDNYDYWHEISRFGLKGWLTAIPVLVYSQVMHASISKLTYPLKSKRYLRGFMLTVFTTSCVVFGAVGITVALWFKKDTEETCTLNFVYNSRHASSNALRALSYFLLLFPVLDVCSAYPLAVLVMKDNLFMVITGRDSVTGSTEGDNQRTKLKKQLLRVVLTISVAILPLTGSFFVANLVDITRYAGLLAFFKCYFYPAAIQLKSQYDCNKAFYKAVKQAQQDAAERRSLLADNGSNDPQSYCDETTPLIEEVEDFRALQYFCWKNPTYTTPYNTLFSHPYMVVFLTLFTFVAFGLAIASLPIRVHESD